MNWKRGIIGTVAALIAAGPVIAPQLLAFPYKAHIGATTVWSVAPLPDAQLRKVLGRADALVAASPIARMPEGRHVFLTGGGWRWRWLALGTSGAFALTRPLNEAVIMNRSNLAADRIFNGLSIGGTRTLSGVIAHETCHGMERRHFGLTVDARKPAWLREGYCDYVARESSLSDSDVAALKARGKTHPAMIYYEGRRRVARELAQDGGSVDALFAAH
ncbi:hypothetical protein RXV95_05600 [Novosphingobium sp. ZN18A2]|uniref:hypothetical protein n=1 Tax=Novosphingobium sp. ZN18A2 TaxID=3079861 RepID=UPI0030CBE83C